MKRFRTQVYRNLRIELWQRQPTMPKHLLPWTEGSAEVDVVILNSCAPGEVSWEDEKFGHGVFMHFVLQGLGGSADLDSNGTLTLGEISKFAADSTKIFVARSKNDSQRPFMSGEWDIDALSFEFGRARPKTITSASTGIELVLIPAGEFMMGSPENEEQRHTNEQQHRVRITKPFYMGKYEVTKGQFARFVAATGYQTEAETGDRAYGYVPEKNEVHKDAKYHWRNPGFSQGDDHPVVCVSWNDAVAYCEWLSRNEGKTYRLPTEAEWEYACRAGTTTQYYHGDDSEGLAHVGNVADGTLQSSSNKIATSGILARDGYVFTAPVGRFQANAFGLHDMHGNVWEWCQDWYDKDYYGASPTSDPPGPASGSLRVLRGGGFVAAPVGLRCAARDHGVPALCSYPSGFRVVCER